MPPGGRNPPRTRQAGDARIDDEPALSISAKLIGVSGVLLLGTLLVYGFVGYDSARDALLPSIREQLADHSLNVKSGLEGMLTAHWRNVHSWARMSAAHGLRGRDADGALSKFLADLRRDYSVYLELLAIDPSGECVASSDANDVGKSYAGTPLVPADPSAERRPSLEWSAQHEKAYVLITAPILDPDDPTHLLARMSALLDREVLDDIVVSRPGHSQIELRLLDESGRLIAGRSPVVRLTHVREWRIDESAQEGAPGHPPPLLREGTDETGRAWLVASVPIGSRESLPTPGWSLTASVPKDVVLAPVTAVRDRVLATGAVLVLLGLVATVVLAKRIAAPIRGLTEVASRIARTGDLEAVPPPVSRDEVGRLALAFQRMVTALDAANDEMVRASKLAFLGEIAAGIAHEIRTPLGIIRSSAQLIERRADASADSEVAQWSRYICEESDRLAHVVTDILDFVKPAPPAKTRNDVSQLLRRSAQMLSAEAAARGVTLELVNVGTPLFVLCDAGQIQQVCLNLLLNALQATPRGGKVRASVWSRGGRAKIVVRDSGRGIPREVLDKLFEPFTSHRDGGIGLGLAIVRRIVRAHEGEVTAGNRSLGGAEFVVSLPPAEPETAAA